MKTSQVITTMMGVALLSGAAWAQAEAPEGQGPRGEGRGFRPDGERRERMEPRERGEMRERMQQCGGCEGMGCQQMQRGGGEGMGRQQMQRGGPGPGSEIGQHGFLNPLRLKEAGATDQQIEALKALADEQQMKKIDLQAAVDKADLALNQLLSSEKPDAAAALKAVDTLSLARAELSKLEIGTRLKMRETLGPDVQKKLRGMGQAEGAERPGMGRGPRPEGQEHPRPDRNAPPAGERPQARE
jgi:Spy/CpxP family protein refolding chaperone